MASARRLAANLFSGVFTNVTRIAIQAVLLPLMANLLGPSELGLYALALPIISFVMLLSDAGLGDSLAKEKGDGTLVWSSAFWGLLATGIILMACLWGVSFLVASVANQPRLPDIMLPLSLTLLMVVMTVIPNAMLLRQGNLVPTALADLFGNIIGAATGITLALYGFGVWSMVALYVVTYATRAIVLNVASPFRPRLEFDISSLFGHTGMGSQILATRLMDLLTRMFENAQVSRRLGAASLGGYSYANQIGFFAANAVGNPLWANLYYVAINRGPAEVSEHYIRAHRIFSLLVFPASAVLALAMPSIVPLLFGEAWINAIPSIMVMVLATPFGNLAVFQTAILFARDRGRLVVGGLALVMLFRVAVVVVAWPFGLIGMSLGLAAANILYFVATLIFINPMIGVRRRDIIRMIAAPIAASTACGAVFWFLVGEHATLVHLVVCGLAALPVYCAALLVLDYRQSRLDLAAVTDLVVQRKPPQPATTH
ncbi:oligosaccharide flippase family protein [Rhizobium sp. 18055]|uniref:oligosaccharide flippase family protein n=1 Tax=Rhizobium sp. 18055 TaxID=2681403 RepID=UPI001358DC01|nr:oligosaccharide flippase family protein [Rhizobium sp. 18055]